MSTSQISWPVMRIVNVKNIARYSSVFAQYFVLASKLIHALVIAVPGIAIISFNQSIDADLLAIIITFSAVSVIVFQAFSIYSEDIFTNLYRFKATLFSWSSAFVFLFLVSKTSETLQELPLFHYLLWFCTTFTLLMICRLLTLYLFKKLMAARFFLSTSIIWGATDSGIELARYLREYQDIRTGLLGFTDDRLKRLPKTVDELELLGDTERLIQMIQEQRVSQVLVALPWKAAHRMDEITSALRLLPVSVLVVPDMQAMKYARNRVSDISGIPMFNVSDFPLKGWSPVLKRLEDIVISSLLIIACAPLMLVIALLIKLDSKGPVLFKQRRYGYCNQLIKVYKFRTMHHSMRDEHASQQTTVNDRRVTPLGRFLRRSSLDELPQLFNVLTGRMSMVGPRPHAKATKAAGVLFEDAVDNYAARHRVKPGITGWAQVNGYRGETNTLEKIEKRVDFDLEYIENWSVLFDLYIILKTIPSVLVSKEAY